MSTENEITIPQNAGLKDYQRLLGLAENEITKMAPKVAQYRVDRTNARNEYDNALSDAKVAAITTGGLKPNHQTMINAYANSNKDVQEKKRLWLEAKALETKAIDRLEQLKGQRDTLKAMVKSEHSSW